MKKIYSFVAIVLLLSCLEPAGVFAQRRRGTVTIKLASMVPENTPWGVAMNRMASEWAQATNGEVILQIYHNGTAGNEPDVLRKLRLNQIQAGVFSSIGLNAITPEIITLSVPFMIRNDGELEAVLNSLKPELEAKIDEKGFFTLAWARAGWIKVFSRSPVFVPGDLKKLKVGTEPTEENLMQAFKAMGYQMEPVAMNDILISLNSGKIDAVYQSPIAVGGYQIFGIAKNMAAINIAPFMGGIIMNRTAWRSIPDQYKPRLLEIAKRIEKEIDTSIFQLENEAINTMIKYGLTINQISPQQEREWYSDVERAMPALLGTTFNRDFYAKIDRILTNYRNGR
jgi:TRAP-type C4-dicarboxylate transport system substrate-binding protein